MGNALLQSLLPQAGFAAGAAGTGAALYGAGLGDLLSPLDYPRQALWNLVKSGGNALTGQGTWDDALRAVPGALGAGLAGGLIASGAGAPLGILAGSLMGGASQGIAKSVDEEKFRAPEISDLTGSDNMLLNTIAGIATDPLTYAGAFGGSAGGRAAAARLGRGTAVADAGLAKAAIPTALEEARTVAAPVIAETRAAHAVNPLEAALARGPEIPGQVVDVPGTNAITPLNEPPAWMAEQNANIRRGEQLANAPHPPLDDFDIPDLPNLGGDRFGKMPGASQPVPGFYSRLEQGINKMPDQMQSQSVINFLKKQGVSNEELATVGIGRALEGKSAVTKQELLDHFAANQIKVNEVPLSGNQTKFGHYAAEGGENYKELLLTYDRPGASESMYNNPNFDPNMTEGPAQYHSGHWDEPDVLAHVRFKDQVGPNGEKILHIQEVQSDLHQAGKELGYLTPETKASKLAVENEYAALDRERRELTKQLPVFASGEVPPSLLEEIDKTMMRAGHYGDPMDIVESVMGRSSQPVPDYLGHMVPEIQEAIANAKNLGGDAKQRLKIINDRIREVSGQMDKYNNAIPDTPFKDNWHELALKRMVRYAAENGYDKIAWNPGESVQSYTHGETAGQAAFYGSRMKPADIGERILGELSEKGGLTGAKAKLVAGELSPEQYGANLQKNATLPNAMNKLGKPFGARVEQSELPGVGEKLIAGTGVHAFPPELLAEYQRLVPGMDPRVLAEELGQMASGVPPHQWRRQVDFMYPELLAAQDQTGSIAHLFPRERFIPPAYEPAPGNPVFSMAMNDKLRQEALMKGFPLMQLLGPAAVGTSPLLAALMSGGRESV